MQFCRTVYIRLHAEISSLINKTSRWRFNPESQSRLRNMTEQLAVFKIHAGPFNRELCRRLNQYVYAVIVLNLNNPLIQAQRHVIGPQAIAVFDIHARIRPLDIDLVGQCSQFNTMVLRSKPDKQYKEKQCRCAAYCRNQAQFIDPGRNFFIRNFLYWLQFGFCLLNFDMRRRLFMPDQFRPELRIKPVSRSLGFINIHLVVQFHLDGCIVHAEFTIACNQLGMSGKQVIELLKFLVGNTVFKKLQKQRVYLSIIHGLGHHSS